MSADSSPLFISTDSALLDVPWICQSLRSSYWGGHLRDSQIANALEGSLVFGAYRYKPLDDEPSGWHDSLAASGFVGGPESWRCAVKRCQIGLLRVVTDGAIFSSITDVFVDESERGHGVGSALMDAAMASDVGHTYCILRARPLAQLWYFKWGFRLLDDSGVMAREPQ